MATYSHDVLLRLWAQNQLTTEQAIGQILQLLHEFEPRLKQLEQALNSPRVVPSSVTPQLAPEPTPTQASPHKRQAHRRAAHR